MKSKSTEIVGDYSKGENENQPSYGREAELAMHFKNCVKNPGHRDFIPVDMFCLEHLPKNHQDNDLYEYIKAIANLTVRISVQMISQNKPTFTQNTKRPYHLSDLRGKSTYGTGTGQVSMIKVYSDKVEQNDYTTCPCDKCKDSDKPSQVWWEICVATAAHVVFDNVEASQTTLRLFYDSEVSPEIILKDKVRVDYVEIKKDRCMLSCVTCDEVLGNKLVQSWIHFNDVWRKVYDKHKLNRDEEKLCIIVSHPHGCAKQVSIGHWKDKIKCTEKDYYQYTYKTCTCPGSSGAIVNLVGYYSGWYTEHVHSRSLGNGLNASGAGFMMDVTRIYESKKGPKKDPKKIKVDQKKGFKNMALNHCFLRILKSLTKAAHCVLKKILFV